jgi:hypothetical protein
VLVIGVLSTGGDHLALMGVVEVREARVVELEVGTAKLSQSSDLLLVCRGQVLPEVLDLGVDAGVDRRATTAVVDHVRRGNRQLGCQLGCRGGHGVAQELEGVAEDRLRQGDAVVHPQSGSLEVKLPLFVGEMDLELLVGLGDAAELVDEVHVPGGAAELPVGGRLEPYSLLHGDDLADALVLESAQLVRGQLASGPLRPRLDKLCGTQQAPDVVSPEWRDGQCGHHAPQV